MCLAFQLYSLGILQLNYLVKRSINVVQREEVKFFRVVPRLVKVVQEHLAHLENRNGGINGTLQAKLSNQIRQGAQVINIRVT